MYLIEYTKIRLRSPTDRTVLIIPSIEKIFEDVSSTRIMESEISMSFEKQMSVSKRLFPTSLIAQEIRVFKLISCSHIKKLQFIHIPINISFKINL